MPPSLTLSIIRYGSRVKWINPGKGVAPSPTPWCSSYWKEAFASSSTMVTNFTYNRAIGQMSRVFANGPGDRGVQSQVESYQRLKKWYLMPPCLTLSIIRWATRVKWSNPGYGVALSLHLGVVAIKKGVFGLPSTKGRQLYFYLLYFHILVCCKCSRRHFYSVWGILSKFLESFMNALYC